MLKCVQFAYSHLLSRSTCAAFSPWLHVVEPGVCWFFLLQLARPTLVKVDLYLRQFSFFLAQVLSG
jgi:hypothetical protein